MAEPVWRAMREDDLEGVMAVSRAAHPGLPERIEVYADRLAIFPVGCQVLADDDKIEGYAVSHPAKLFAPPLIDVVLGQIPEDADSYYIHDVAVSPAVRDAGHARIGVYHALDLGDAYRETALISVYGTVPFWQRFGFIDRTRDFDRRKLEIYGADARYMVRRRSAVEFTPRAG